MLKRRWGPLGGWKQNGVEGMWVADWQAPYGKEPQVDPWGPPGGGGRVTRGGGFWVVAVRARAAFRINGFPGDGFGGQGFRVVLPAGPELIGG